MTSLNSRENADPELLENVISIPLGESGERWLAAVLAERGATLISQEEFDEMFGDLPRDGEG